MEFEAEIKETKQSKRVSLDNVYCVKFETDDPMVMDLGKLPPDSRIRVTVELIP